MPPPARGFHDLAYDSGRDRIVLFGGYSLGAGRLSDTWEFDGAAWARRLPVTSPIARDEHAMAFDSRRGRTVLFGGYIVPGGSLSDTWEWDGVNWLERFPATSPPARHDHGMVYDSARGRVVLYGGLDFSLPRPELSDTWEWDGTNWTRASTGSPPGRHAGHAMAYDAARRRVVLFEWTETWEWDGTTWTLRDSGQPFRSQHAMAYDAVRARVVRFGGWTYPQPVGELDDTWEWDGTRWTQRAPAANPPGRRAHAMTYDSRRSRVVLFGGWLGSGPGFSDTWEYSAPCDLAGPGQPSGGAMSLVCGGVPRIGGTFCLGYLNPGPPSYYLSLLLIGPTPAVSPPFALAPPLVCAPSYLHLLPQVVLSTPGNPAVFCFTLPPDPPLIGASFTVQGAASVLGMCFRVTDALVLTLRS
jgi:hypothetical protein